SFLLLAVALVLLAERSLRKGRNFAFARAKPKQTTRPQLNPKYTSIAIIICAYPPLLGFILPGAVLLHLALQTTPDAGLINAIRASLSLSLASIFTILLPVLPIAYGLRRRGQRQIHGLSGLSVGANGRIASLVTNTITLGYATPGAVIAIGVVTVFATIGGGGAILALGVAGLLYAYAVRFAAPALEVIDAGLAKIRPSLEDAARGLGCNTPKTLLRVHLPLLWPSLATAALIVFVEVLKELPATLLIRPFGFETLAVRAWSLAADERLHQASYPALLIMGVGIIPVWLLLRTTGGGVPPQVASRHRLKCAALVGAAPPLLTRRGWVRGCQRKAL
ncbi:MAG: ABC transporter permease subunit, partial [Alphaproteobacteria bacterium]